ncbi:MAG: T9SS type A sorting domain-containing protein, partial [Bacteroidota bacterium]
NIFNNVTGLSVLKDGNIALYGDYGNNYPYCTYFNHYLQKIDTAGTLIFAKDYHHTFRASHGTGGMIEMEDSSLLFTMAFIDTIAGHTVPYFNHLSENGQLLNSTAFDIPYGHYSFALNISNEFNDLIPVCRLNDWDTILFMNIDTSLTAICGTVPNAMVDSDLVITPELFNSVYLPYTFTFHDTLFPAFQQVPIQYTDGCSGNSIAESRSGKPLTLFPNPTSGKLRIRNAPFEINEISLYNLPGSLVYSWKYTGTKKEIAIDISDLAPGVYIYKVSGRDNERRGKIVKE